MNANKQKAVLTIRITHPSYSSEQISRVMGCAPDYSSEVGAHRRTPKGELLDGKYDKTYWSKELGSHDASFTKLIQTAIVQLNRATAGYNEMLIAGGEVEFFIGVFVDSNFGDTLPVATLQQLAERRVELGFDIYGRPG